MRSVGNQLSRRLPGVRNQGYDYGVCGGWHEWVEEEILNSFSHLRIHNAPGRFIEPRHKSIRSQRLVLIKLKEYWFISSVIGIVVIWVGWVAVQVNADRDKNQWVVETSPITCTWVGPIIVWKWETSRRLIWVGSEMIAPEASRNDRMKLKFILFCTVLKK